MSFPREISSRSRKELRFQKFLQNFSAEFLATSEVGLRKHLVEFNDHNLIRQDGNLINLTIDRDLLITFLESKVEND